MRRRGPVRLRKNVTHKSQEQLAKFIGFQIGESNDKRATTIPTYLNICLFLAVTLRGFSYHVEREMVDEFNFNFAQFVCRFKFNSQGYYYTAEKTSHMRIHSSVYDNRQHELLFAAAKKKERKTIENGHTKQIRHHSDRMIIIRACVWVCAWLSSHFHREWTWNRPLSLSQEFLCFIQNRHNCCLV